MFCILNLEECFNLIGFFGFSYVDFSRFLFRVEFSRES